MTKRLIFGDPESIAIRDAATVEFYEKKLLHKVTCPVCGRNAVRLMHVDIYNEILRWEIVCDRDCIDSLSVIKTNLEGKTI